MKSNQNNKLTYFQNFELMGKKYVNQKFQLDKEDESKILQLSGYKYKTEPLLEEFNMDKEKGLFLAGPVGCGKTSFMHILKGDKKNNEFRIISAIQIVEEYKKNNSSMPNSLVNVKILCIDDIGREPLLNSFGTVVNVIANLIRERYNKAEFGNGEITHATTNFSVEFLNEKYGDDITSRFNSLFNPILFPNNSIDKRKYHPSKRNEISNIDAKN